MKVELKLLCDLFEKKIGLNSEMISNERWRRIVKERMTLCEEEDVDRYIHYLLSSSVEFQEVVELVVVPETWFFRNKTSLEFFIDYAKAWLDSQRGCPLRILSLPCSSGEEPYSIAMMLLAEGISTDLVEIEGVDISKKALAKAESGEYTKNSFRTKNTTLCERFFTQVGFHFLLQPAVRQMVCFAFGNVFELDCEAIKAPYDVVFCQNLFIYLHQEAQKNAVKRLQRLLTPEGLLIVSPAEIEIVRSFGLTAFGPSKACAFQNKTKLEQKQSLPQKGAFCKDKKGADSTAFLPLAKKQECLLIDKARQLADAGELSEALEMCYERLKECNTDPNNYFLMGLIEHAQGREKAAEDYFLKAVYLDPDHYEALVHLALIAERRGELVQAARFRKRAKRVEKITC